MRRPSDSRESRERSALAAACIVNLTFPTRNLDVEGCGMLCRGSERRFEEEK